MTRSMFSHHDHAMLIIERWRSTLFQIIIFFFMLIIKKILKKLQQKSHHGLTELISWLVLWVQSTTKDYIRAEHKARLESACILCVTDVAKNVQEAPEFSESHCWHHKGINKWLVLSKQLLNSKWNMFTHTSLSQWYPFQSLENKTEKCLRQLLKKKKKMRQIIWETDWWVSLCWNSLVACACFMQLFQLHFACTIIKWLYGAYWEKKNPE